MGWFLRKSLKIGPVRFNLSKSGIGTSVGVTGFRVGVRPNGKSFVHAGRYGLYYRQELGSLSDERQSEEQTLPESPSDPNVTKYDSALSKDLIPSTHKDLLEKLNQSYKTFRIDYLVGITSVISALLLIQYSQIIATVIGISGIIVFIITARWETKRRTIQLFYDFKDENGEHFKKVIDAFNNLASCSMVWAMIDSKSIYDSHEAKRNAGASNLVNRTTVQVGEGKPPWVETNIDVPLIKARGQALYMMPDGILVYDNTGVGFVDYHELEIESDTTRFIEERAPSDAKVVDTTWKHPNKSGGPDRRFSNNYEMPICLYGELRLKSPKGMNFYFMTSNDVASEKFLSSMLEPRKETSLIKNDFSNTDDEDRLREGEVIDTKGSKKFRKIISAKENVRKQSMSMICPYCSEEFETEIDLSKAQEAGVATPVEVNATCPFCSENIKGAITMQSTSDWSCEFCGQEFPSEKDAEIHEETCDKRNK